MMCSVSPKGGVGGGLCPPFIELDVVTGCFDLCRLIGPLSGGNTAYIIMYVYIVKAWRCMCTRYQLYVYCVLVEKLMYGSFL